MYKYGLKLVVVDEVAKTVIVTQAKRLKVLVIIRG